MESLIPNDTIHLNTTLPDVLENSTDVPSSRKNSNTVIPVVMMFVFGTSGNILALAVLLYNSKKHKWRTFYRFVGALAVSDFIGICGTLPISMANYHNGKKWVGGQPLCDFMSFILIFSGMASVLLASSISLERFLAVWCPHFYHRRVNSRSVNISILIVLLFSSMMGSLPLIGMNDNVYQFPGTWCFFNMFSTEPRDKAFSFLYAFIGILAVLLMIIMNSLVILLLGKRCGQEDIQKRHTGTISRHIKTACNVNDVYNIVFLVVLTLVFTICWIPLMVRTIINQSGNDVINRKADLLVVRLSLVNQILDPWIYILLRKDILVKCIRYVKYNTAMGKSRLMQKMNTDDDLTEKTTEGTLSDQHSTIERNLKI